MSKTRIIWSDDDGWPGNESTRVKWLSAVAQDHHKRIDLLEYYLVSDEELLAINEQHLRHDDWTDIITFDYSRGSRIRGEIYISRERVQENARLYEQTDTVELLRVIAHGLLHLCGLKDKSPQEQKQMRDAEERALLEYSKVSRGT